MEMFDEQIATLIKADGTVEPTRGSAALPRPAGRWTPSHRHAGLLCNLHSPRTSQESIAGPTQIVHQIRFGAGCAQFCAHHRTLLSVTGCCVPCLTTSPRCTW